MFVYTRAGYFCDDTARRSDIYLLPLFLCQYMEFKDPRNIKFGHIRHFLVEPRATSVLAQRKIEQREIRITPIILLFFIALRPSSPRLNEYMCASNADLYLSSCLLACMWVCNSILYVYRCSFVGMDRWEDKTTN